MSHATTDKHKCFHDYGVFVHPPEYTEAQWRCFANIYQRAHVTCESRYHRIRWHHSDVFIGITHKYKQQLHP